VGKTRLADEVARLVAPRFADGVWLAELASVRDSARVAAVVAVALGVREQPGMPAADVVMRVLARRQVLVVLDNCEHVIGAAAQLCAGLLGPVMMCGSWRPAGSRCGSRARRRTGWRRCRYPARVMTWPGPRR
jgi:predicted ATPase